MSEWKLIVSLSQSEGGGGNHDREGVWRRDEGMEGGDRGELWMGGGVGRGRTWKKRKLTKTNFTPHFLSGCNDQYHGHVISFDDIRPELLRLATSFQ